MDSLATCWDLVDKGISATNKNRAEFALWGTITDDENEFLASWLIEGGMKNRVVARAVRQIAATNKFLRLGLITLPRAYASWRHYLDNAGFALPSFRGDDQ